MTRRYKTRLQCIVEVEHLSVADQRFSSDRVVKFQQMFVVPFLPFAVEIDLFREPLSVVVRRDLSDEVNMRIEQNRTNERTRKRSRDFLCADGE